MVLVDSSVWIDHLRSRNAKLQTLLTTGLVLCHPMIVGELAMGTLRRRNAFLADLRLLPSATVAGDEEVLDYVQRHHLFGRGIGYIDVHLLAATRLSPGSRLWTRDRRLHTVARSLGLAF